MSTVSSSPEGVAIVAMAGRFPGAASIEEFWANLCAGRETISRFTTEELAAAGVRTPADPNYVKARGVVPQADWFDAAFFGLTPKEAELIDPQHRIFLECSAEALERAGCDPQRYDGLIGVFGGSSLNTYAVNNLYSHEEYRERAGSHQFGLANEKDYLPARVSYKLGLRGPSVAVQTACATSLSAVCIACQNLLSHQCDLALAGGASLLFPQAQGYWHQVGGIFSPDGHCRTFDAAARGTVPGDGVAVIALKRLANALADGDTIYAVIKGFALGNDGSLKAGFAAPSAEGQADTVMLAQAMAGIDPATIGYVEAHGTGTIMGDPIEMEALTEAFRAGTGGTQYCAIGSVKSNIGHLDAAAGAAGLIKAVLALHHKQIPPSLNFESPNPQIDFENSAFYVAKQLTPWPATATPRRAGVNSLGMGGNNVHVVLEEAPTALATTPSSSGQLLVLSAKTATALDQASANLAAHLEQNPQLNLADAAWTLQMGRRPFAHRRIVAAHDAKTAVAALRAGDTRRSPSRQATRDDTETVFLFTGQGAQQVNMGRELYDHEPRFRAEIDACAQKLRPQIGLDLRDLLYPEAGREASAQVELDQTRFTQPALFAVEYALAQLWQSWGVRPAAMIGHSLGEYVAACLAGVFPLETALSIVAARAQLMQDQPAGAMLAVRLSEADLRPRLNSPVSLAAVNAATACVVSGTFDAVGQLEQRLLAEGIACRPLRTSHAFHSAMMEPAVSPFLKLLEDTRLNPPRIPLISNLTGTWLTVGQATSPRYWADHLRHTVRFADGLGEVLKTPGRALVEIGPGQTLSGLARQHPAGIGAAVVSSLVPPPGECGDFLGMLHALGQLWSAGVPIDWEVLHRGERRGRMLLPTYPFERQRYYIEPAQTTSRSPQVSVSTVESIEPASTAKPVTVDDQRGSNPMLARVLKSFFDLAGINLAAHTTTTFAELGYDSLFLAQAATALGKEFGVPIAFRDLLGNLGTIQAITAHFEAKTGASRSETNDRLPETSAEKTALTTAPLTVAQKEIWLASQVSDAASCAYNESRQLCFRGSLNLEALRAAFQRVGEIHESLRTTFSLSGEELRIAAQTQLELPVDDLLASDAEERAVRLQQIERDEAERPFDLVRGPVWRARLAQTGAEEHVLFITIHHIACDGHAWGIVLRELAEQYAAAVSGTRREVMPRLQLGTYARTEAARVDKEAIEAAESYWRAQFADGVPILELPTDRPRPAQRDFRGGRECRVLGAGLRDDLRRLSARENCTLFATLLTAFSVWLRRLSGQNDLVVGVPLAERTQPGAETLVAHCVDFLPVRMRVEDSAPFSTLQNQTKDGFFDAFEHRQCGFGQIQRVLELPHDALRQPLASVSFNVDRMHESLAFAGLEVEARANASSYVNFDLSFSVLEIGSELRLDCQFSTALFDAETIRRWLSHFETLLHGIVARPEETVGRLPILTDIERHQILSEWNATEKPFAQNICLPDLFAAQVARTPNEKAVEWGDAAMTYVELDRRSDDLARQLRLMGVRPDMRVALCLPRSLAVPVAVLAVLKAGGAYVPLDPAYPPERIGYMLEDSRAAVLLVPAQPTFAIAPGQVPLLALETNGESRARISGEPTTTQVEPHHLAYVLYTSGSTGRPKGVAMPHAPLVNLIDWQLQNSTAGVGTRTLQFASLSFDVSFQEMFATWCSGGTLVLVDEDTKRDPDELLYFLRRQRIARIFLPYVALQQLAEMVSTHAPVPESLCEVITAGEPLQVTPKVVEFFSKLPGCALHNQYGPTETHVVSLHALVGSPKTWPARPPIGRPIANTRIYLLDARSEPVPIGVAGEVYLGGVCLARGYLGRPELTAEKFITSPFRAGERLYRTGDLARYRADGEIEFLGRIDHQVKIRGYRIELGEVESVLSRHRAVKACAVVALDDGRAGKRLVAYVTPAAGEVAAPADLRRFLEKQLPDYMIPSGFVSLETMPLTPSGKLNRRALPMPIRDERAPEKVEMTPPSTPMERALAEIWQELLGVDAVSIHDDFFALGGHSLLAVQLTARLRVVFQVELPVRRVFEAPTIAALAADVEERLIAEIGEMSEADAERCARSA